MSESKTFEFLLDCCGLIFKVYFVPVAGVGIRNSASMADIGLPTGCMTPFMTCGKDQLGILCVHTSLTSPQPQMVVISTDVFATL